MTCSHDDGPSESPTSEIRAVAIGAITYTVLVERPRKYRVQRVRRVCIAAAVVVKTEYLLSSI